MPPTERPTRPFLAQLALYFGLATDPTLPPVEHEVIQRRRISAVILLVIVVALLVLILV